MLLTLVAVSFLACGAFGGTTEFPLPPPDQPGNNSASNDEQFTKLADGVYADWEKADAENVKNNKFEFVYANYSLYLVSRRPTKDADSPWGPINQGGIVSKLSLDTKTWTHKPFSAIANEEQNADIIFSLGGRLFLLTHNNTDGRFHSLHIWADEEGTWKAVSMGSASPEVFYTAPFRNSFVIVSVPDPNEHEVFIANSFFNGGGQAGGSEQSIIKIAITFGENNAARGSLKPVAKHVTHEEIRIVDIVKTEKHLLALVDDVNVEGAFTKHDFALTLGDGGNVTLANADIVKGSQSTDRLHQTDQNLYAFGGNIQNFGKSEIVNDIYALDLAKLEWRKLDASVPKSHEHDEVTIDPNNFYWANLKDGVFHSPRSQ